MREVNLSKRSTDLTPWIVIIGIIAAFFLARFLSSSSTFTGLTDQRGTQGTGTGLYGPTLTQLGANSASIG